MPRTAQRARRCAARRGKSCGQKWNADLRNGVVFNCDYGELCSSGEALTIPLFLDKLYFARKALMGTTNSPLPKPSAMPEEIHFGPGVEEALKLYAREITTYLRDLPRLLAE